jgi:thioredoxin-related protein
MTRAFIAASTAPALALVFAGACLAPARAATSTATATAAPKPSAGLEWVESHDVAVARAKKERKILLLDFYTDWCGWCKRLDADVFSQESFAKAATGVLFVKVNAERQPALAQHYKVSSYPRLFFVDSDGMTLEQIRGYLSLADFTAKVEQIKRGDTEFARARDAANDQTNMANVYRFARMLSDDSQHDRAMPYWQQVHDLALEQVFANPNNNGALQYHREALVELGRGYAAVGLEDAARQNLNEVVRQYSDSPSAGDALVALAEIELKKPGGAEKARPLLERALQEHPGTPAAQSANSMLVSMSAAAQPAKAGQ